MDVRHTFSPKGPSSNFVLNLTANRLPPNTLTLQCIDSRRTLGAGESTFRQHENLTNSNLNQLQEQFSFAQNNSAPHLKEGGESVDPTSAANLLLSARLSPRIVSSANQSEHIKKMLEKEQERQKKIEE